jgi:hypothetical protein
MNERIKELAIQAGFFYEDYKDIWYLEYHNQTCEEEMKKFAELIVQECASMLYEKAGRYRQSGFAHESQTARLLGDALKEHFGVG